MDDLIALVVGVTLLSLAFGPITGIGVVTLVYFHKDRRGH